MLLAPSSAPTGTFQELHAPSAQRLTSADHGLQALKGLDAAHQPGGNAEADPAARKEQAAFLQGAVMRRLADEDASVVDTVLSLPFLHQLPESLLYSGLAAVLQKFDRLTGLKSDKSRHKAWRAVAKKVLTQAAC